MRVLILDFDLFTATGGGPTFYRRVIERHPYARILYPSRGPDLRRRAALPPNAEPFALDPDGWDPAMIAVLRDAGLCGSEMERADTTCAVARALQGETLDVVEVPSYRPCAHLVRPILTAHGIRVGRVSLGLLGWIGTSVRLAGAAGASDEELAAIEAMEAASVAAADVRYTISAQHVAENARHGAPIGLVDMYSVLETFPPPAQELPGEGPPDLWYIGRLDPAKAPDLFLELAARVPRSLFHRLLLTGPDSIWLPQGQRWSDDVLAGARLLGLPAEYRGVMPDAALRAEAYRGRSVVVIPSRTDSFNLVALEALANACPVLLSCNTGAAGFLQRHHPAIAPPVVDPEALPEAAAALAQLLAEYPARRAALRDALRDHPLPAPQEGFLDPFWQAAPLHPLAPPARRLFEALRSAAPLCRASAVVWRPLPATGAVQESEVSAVVVTRAAPAALGATLAAVARQSVPPAEVLVVADGLEHIPAMQDAAAGHGMAVRLLAQGPRGLASALNRGCAEARREHVLLLVAGDLPAPGCAAAAEAGLRGTPGAAACAVPWAWLEADGTKPAGDHALPGWDGPAVLVARDALLAAGGFAATADGAGILPPPGLRLAVADGTAPLAWRPRDVVVPWRMDARMRNVRPRQEALA